MLQGLVAELSPFPLLAIQQEQRANMGFIEKHSHCSSYDSFHFMAVLLSTKLAMPSATVLDPRAQKGVRGATDSTQVPGRGHGKRALFSRRRHPKAQFSRERLIGQPTRGPLRRIDWVWDLQPYC